MENCLKDLGSCVNLLVEPLDFNFESRVNRFEQFWVLDRNGEHRMTGKERKDGNGIGLNLNEQGKGMTSGLGTGTGKVGCEAGGKGFEGANGHFGNGKGEIVKEQSGFAGLADLLVKQGEVFCREIWPGLSIRNIFFRHCNINETLNTVPDTLPVMTEMDSESIKTFVTEVKKYTARDYLGYDLPDLSFMLASSIQWPPEYLKQI